LRSQQYGSAGNLMEISGSGNFRKFPEISNPSVAFPPKEMEILVTSQGVLARAHERTTLGTTKKPSS